MLAQPAPPTLVRSWPHQLWTASPSKGWVRGLPYSSCIYVILHNTYIRTYIHDYIYVLCLAHLFFSPVPSYSPTSFQVTDRHSSSITVQWGAVDCIHRNGDITGYSVRYGVQGSGSTQTESVSGGATTEATIFGLTHSTTYEIEVAAVNSAGIGVYSEPLTVETSVAGESRQMRAVLLWLLVPYIPYSIRCLCQIPGSGSLQPQLCGPHYSGGCYGWQ